PSYDPAVVYGLPVYPYPAYYYPGYVPGAGLAFGTGLILGAAWANNWGNCNWGHGDITINNNNNFNRNDINNINRGQQGGKWQHSAQHRGGAPYGDRNTANKYGGRARQQPAGGAGNRAGAGGAGTANRPGGGGAGTRPGGGGGTASRPGSGGAGTVVAAGAEVVAVVEVEGAGDERTIEEENNHEHEIRCYELNKILPDDLRDYCFQLSRHNGASRA